MALALAQRQVVPSFSLEGVRGIGVLGNTIKDVYVGDLVWLYFWEQMGTFRIQGAILDDFASKGRFAIQGTTAQSETLEDMVELTNMGLSSRTRDRNSTYMRCLGWSRNGEATEGVASNDEFRENFDKFLKLALTYYNDKRLAVAITRRTDTPPSDATKASIRETITALKASMSPFKLGRNRHNTLAGIVWVWASRKLIKDLRQELGIPPNPPFDQEKRYIPAAYALLVERRPIGTASPDRYIYHDQAAKSGRDIVLGLEALDETNDQLLETWLNVAEPTIESYRTAVLRIEEMKKKEKELTLEVTAYG